MVPRRRPGDVAFRLLNEMHGILEGIKADGFINPAEVRLIRRWLDANAAFAQVAPFAGIAQIAETAIADGVLTIDEVDDLLFVTEKLTTTNRYFGTMRAGVQTLMGLLSGIASDAVILPDEVRALMDWLDEWSSLKGLWPYDECEAVVTDIIANKKMRHDDCQALLVLATWFPVTGAIGEAPAAATLTRRGICAVDPEIVFQARSFVFTGDSPREDRATMAQLVVDRGGDVHSNVRMDTNYLVVCDCGSEYWAFSCYGRKIEKAIKYRERGERITIARESDFWDALVT